MKNGYFEYTDNFSSIKETESVMVLGNPNRKRRLMTIAIPTYKRAELLETSLKSAVNQLHFKDFEVIIVDNDPESVETEKVVRKYLKDNVYYFRNKANIGLYNNWNRCIELAKGRYISILNDDDWLSPLFLAQCRKHLGKNVDGLYFKYQTVYEKAFSDKGTIKNERFSGIKNCLARDQRKLTSFDFLLGNKSAGSLGTLFNTSKLKQLGGYNAAYHPSSDYILHANFCHQFNVYRINKTMSFYRVAENESARQEVLKTWEYLDTDIRCQIIRRIGKHRLFLQYINMLVTDLQIKSLIENWDYETETKVTYNLQHKLLEKVSGLKYDLNL